MLIYGSRTSQLAESAIPSACPHCGNEGTVHVEIHKKYAHFFFIPMFPLGRLAATECSHCKQVLGWEEMPDSFKEATVALGSTVRNPLWHWAGSVLLIGFIAGLAFLFIGDAKRGGELAAQPQKGDVWSVRLPDHTYTLLKVVDVTSDSVKVRHHSFQVNKVKGLREMRELSDSLFAPLITAMSRQDLIDQQGKKELFAPVREK
jgi:hypothetical protein